MQSTQAPSASEAGTAPSSARLDNFSCIVERYQRLVWGVAYAATGDKALSEDVTQETFLAAWKQQADLRDVAKIRSYLASIARNLAYKSCRRAGREVGDVDAGVDEECGQPGPLECVLEQEKLTLVQDALQTIPSASREPFVLFYLEDQSVSRVASELVLSESAVKQRLYRARESLKESMATRLVDSIGQGHRSKPLAGAIISAIAAQSAAASAATVASLSTAPVSASTSAGIGGATKSAGLFGLKSLKPALWIGAALSCAIGAAIVVHQVSRDVDASNLPQAAVVSEAPVQASTSSVPDASESLSKFSSLPASKAAPLEAAEPTVTPRRPRGKAHEQPLITGRILQNLEGADASGDYRLSEEELDTVREQQGKALSKLIVSNWQDTDKEVYCKSVGMDEEGVYEHHREFPLEGWRDDFRRARKAGYRHGARAWVTEQIDSQSRSGQICHTLTLRFHDKVREARAKAGGDVNWNVSVLGSDSKWIHFKAPEALAKELRAARHEKSVNAVANKWGVRVYAYGFGSYYDVEADPPRAFEFLHPDIQAAALAESSQNVRNLGPGAVIVVE